MLDYVGIAKEAAVWARDMTLSSGQRKIAEQLADLADILAIEGYGCPSEHEAAEIMYRSLRFAFESRHNRSLPLFLAVRERRMKPRYVSVVGNS